MGVRVGYADGARDFEVRAGVVVIGGDGAAGGAEVGEGGDDEGLLDALLPDPGARGGLDDFPLAPDGVADVGGVDVDEEELAAEGEVARVNVVDAGEYVLRMG